MMTVKTGNDNITGSLLGTAVGDAIGLPAEGLPRERVLELYKNGVRHRLFFGKGMFSDDTEHSRMVAVALRKYPDDVVQFQRSLAWSLRWWMLALPAGVGLGTAKAILRLWLGFPVERAGVKSAGNGAAMRSAVIGTVFHSDAARRHKFALAACRITHTDPRAEESVLLVAEAAALACRGSATPEITAGLKSMISSAEMKSRWAILEKALDQGREVAEYAGEIGCGRGVSGFAPNSVAVALFAWLRHRGNFEEAISSVVRCGGDTDTVAAIAGGICGAESGETGIPGPWLEGIRDWPGSMDYLRKVARSLTDKSPLPSFPWWAVPFRNMLFLVIVLGHGFRRLFSHC